MPRLQRLIIPAPQLVRKNLVDRWETSLIHGGIASEEAKTVDRGMGADIGVGKGPATVTTALAIGRKALPRQEGGFSG